MYEWPVYKYSLSGQAEIGQHLINVFFLLRHHILTPLAYHLLFFSLHFSQNLFEHIVYLLFIGFVLHHPLQLFLNLSLTNPCLLTLHHDGLQLLSIFLGAFDDAMHLLQGVNRLQIHQGLFKLLLVLFQDLPSKGVTSHFLLESNDFLPILFSIFLLTSYYQFLCFLFQDFYLVLELSLVTLEFLDLSVQLIELGFYPYLFGFIFLFFSRAFLWRGGCDRLRLSCVVPEQPIYEIHADKQVILYYLQKMARYTINQSNQF